MITARKRPLFDSGNAAWNRYACQSPAVTKQLLLDLFQSFRQNNFFKTTALVKRAPPDARHALRQTDIDQISAFVKSRFSNARYSIRHDGFRVGSRVFFQTSVFNLKIAHSRFPFFFIT